MKILFKKEIGSGNPRVVKLLPYGTDYCLTKGIKNKCYRGHIAIEWGDYIITTNSSSSTKSYITNFFCICVFHRNGVLVGTVEKGGERWMFNITIDNKRKLFHFGPSTDTTLRWDELKASRWTKEKTCCYTIGYSKSRNHIQVENALLLAVSSLISVFHEQDIFNLTLVSHSISVRAREYINQNYVFEIKRESNETGSKIFPYLWYKPQRISNILDVTTKDISELHQINEDNQKIITHLYFAPSPATNKYKLDFPSMPALFFLDFNDTLHTTQHKEIFLKKLPSTITHLKFGYENLLKFDNNESFRSTFPSLTHLAIPNVLFQFSLKDLPYSLTHFSACAESFNGENLALLPPSISHLKISGSNYIVSFNNLPSSITHLTLDNFNHSIDSFPPNLIKLIIYGSESDWNNTTAMKLFDNLPSSLSYLQLPGLYNSSIDRLPKNLKHLTTGWAFNKEINFLPNGLTHLELGDRFNQPIDSLPLSLSHLSFGQDFNQPLPPLPSSLSHLTFVPHSKFNHPDSLQERILASSLRVIDLPKSISLPANLPPSMERVNKWD